MVSSSVGGIPWTRRDKMPKAPVNGINMYYQVHGDGEPLVMVQGFAGGHEAWFFQLRAFKKHYKVVIFDNRGITRSGGADQCYTIKTMAEDVVGLMDYLGIPKAHILGLSLGGIVAQEIAISYPERVMKLILGSTFAGSEGNDVHPEMVKAFATPEGAASIDFRSIPIEKVMYKMISLAFNKRLYRMILLPLSKRSTKSINPEGHFKQMAAVSDYTTLDRLHLIKAPTLVITGTGDRIISPGASEVIASRIPNAKLVLVKGGSHAFFMEMRGRFNKEVLEFLRGG
jgi:pimeloyl-ACP methyl ester carboxylesterase